MHQIKNLKNIYFKKMSFLYSSKAFSPTGTSEILAVEGC